MYFTFIKIRKNEVKIMDVELKPHSVPRVILTFKISNMEKFDIYRTLTAWGIIGYIHFFQSCSLDDF